MLVPVGENVLVSPIQLEEQTSAGIYLPDTARVTPDKGKIVSVGEDVKCADKLTQGVVVLFRKGVGHSVTYQNEDYLILPIKEIIGIVVE